MVVFWFSNIWGLDVQGKFVHPEFRFIEGGVPFAAEISGVPRILKMHLTYKEKLNSLASRSQQIFRESIN